MSPSPRYVWFIQATRLPPGVLSGTCATFGGLLAPAIHGPTVFSNVFSEYKVLIPTAEHTQPELG